ncbi:MAG: ABC transporter permease [Phycisphaerae bacterium]
MLQDLGRWLWRLVPANPILVRVVYAGGRRLQHVYIRAGYLGVLAALVIGGVLFTQSGTPSLADLAKGATQVFKYVSAIQLGMVCILAPLFTAAAITQEKNAQTFNILLSTPLTNGQIVLGSLLSRLYFVFMLLLAGIPLFCIMMVYGGVTGDKILLSSSLAGCTAVLTGSLAIAISVIRVGTGRTIFSFYLAIALYLTAVYALAGWSNLIPPESMPAPGEMERMSWLAPFHPFLSLWVVLGRTPAPDFGAAAHYGWPLNIWLAYPQYSYIVMTLVLSALLVLASLAFVRRCVKEGEPTLMNRIFGRFQSAEGSPERRRRPRRVGRNPVAWREATSRAAGGGAVARYTMLALGFLVAMTILVYYGRGMISVQETRLWLFGVVVVELGITLFIATATAATSMTSEKESNTLELLLSTPITSGKVVWGKISGLVRFALPMLAVPYGTVVLFVLFDLVRGHRFGNTVPVPVMYPDALLTLPLLFVAFTAVACMTGLHYSIKRRKTLAAVFTSGGILVFAVLALSGCARAVVGSSEPMAAAIMPFAPYYAVWLAIDPATALAESFAAPVTGAALESARIAAAIASFVAAGIYGAIGYGLHTSMVRNFDMTIRKQTA